jgi:hypothetical protein
MTCALCSQPIATDDVVNQHHVIYRSQGGTETQPTHKACHVALHSSRNDFAKWGKQGGKKAALTMRWAFNLRHVRTHPAYAEHRWFYLMNHSNAGLSAGLVM